MSAVTIVSPAVPTPINANDGITDVDAKLRNDRQFSSGVRDVYTLERDAADPKLKLPPNCRHDESRLARVLDAKPRAEDLDSYIRNHGPMVYSHSFDVAPQHANGSQSQIRVTRSKTEGPILLPLAIKQSVVNQSQSIDLPWLLSFVVVLDHASTRNVIS
jgi:hypothetical protein